VATCVFCVAEKRVSRQGAVVQLRNYSVFESVVAVAMYKLRVVLTERSLTGLFATFLPKWKFSEYDSPIHESVNENVLTSC
jgi:hypothetical protein